MANVSGWSCKPQTAHGDNPPWFFSPRSILHCFSVSCVSPLGLESGEIPDEALSHSLPANHASKPRYIRPSVIVTNFPYGWFSRPVQNPPDYLQIDFGSLRKVTRLSSMGGHGIDFYVATYKLSHSKDGLTWIEYRENGQIKVSGLIHFSPVDFNGYQKDYSNQYWPVASVQALQWSKGVQIYCFWNLMLYCNDNVMEIYCESLRFHSLNLSNILVGISSIG